MVRLQDLRPILRGPWPRFFAAGAFLAPDAVAGLAAVGAFALVAAFDPVDAPPFAADVLGAAAAVALGFSAAFGAAAFGAAALAAGFFSAAAFGAAAFAAGAFLAAGFFSLCFLLSH